MEVLIPQILPGHVFTWWALKSYFQVYIRRSFLHEFILHTKFKGNVKIAFTCGLEVRANSIGHIT